MTVSRATQVSAIASGQAITAVSALLTTAILARWFDYREYATYREVFLVFAFLTPLLTLGIPDGLLFFLSRNSERARSVIVSNVLILAVLGSVSGGLVLAGSELVARLFHNPGLAPAMGAMSLYPLLLFPASSVGPGLVARNRAGQYALYASVSAVLKTALVLTATWYFGTVTAALGGNLLGAGVALIWGLHSLFCSCPNQEWRPSLRMIREQWKFGVGLGLANLLGRIQTDASQAVVASSTSPQAFAFYSNGAVEVPFIAIITGAVTPVLTVDMASQLKEGRRDQALRLWRAAMIKCSTLLLPLMVILLITARPVMVTLFSPKYEASAAFFRLFLLLLPIRSTNFGAVFVAAGRSDQLLVRSLLAVLCVVPAVALGTYLAGPIGAASGTVLAIYALVVPLNVFMLGRVFGVPWTSVIPFSRLTRIALVSAVAGLPCLILSSLVAPLPAIIGLAIVGGSYFLVVVALFRWAGIDEPFDAARVVLTRAR